MTPVYIYRFIDYINNLYQSKIKRDILLYLKA